MKEISRSPQIRVDSIGDVPNIGLLMRRLIFEVEENYIPKKVLIHSEVKFY